MESFRQKVTSELCVKRMILAAVVVAGVVTGRARGRETTTEVWVNTDALRRGQRGAHGNFHLLLHFLNKMGGKLL